MYSFMFPAVLNIRLTRSRELPAELARVLQGCGQQGRLMHQLLGNTAHVHTRAAQTWTETSYYITYLIKPACF